MTEPVYIVSGFVRTGTTPMMKALEAGGMTCAYDDENYELSPIRFNTPTFPEGYEGKVVKIFGSGLERLYGMPDGIKIIMMKRPAYEVVPSAKEHLGLIVGERMVTGVIERGLHQASFRRDMTVIEVELHELRANPVMTFKRLVKDGWPIDVKKAAKTILAPGTKTEPPVIDGDIRITRFPKMSGLM